MEKIKEKFAPVHLNWLSLVIITLCLITFKVTGQETRTITGTVVAEHTEEPLPGVTVQIRGTTLGTITDIDGRYSLEASPDDVLNFRFVGYLAKNVAVEDRRQIDVVLQRDVIGLEEVVVTGYGVQQKSLITGSIESVGGDDIRSVRVPSATQALQGLAAGVQVVPRTGRPGEESDIRIRGVSSISGTDPLIIVDGVPGSLEGLNPNDIESIEVLKDASSAAIYGATGGNGVILVTTRSGQEGEIKTNFEAYGGLTRETNRVDLMNSQEWAGLMIELGAFESNRIDTFPNYDWQDIVFKDAITQNYDLSISGGDNGSTYMLAANYNKQDGIVQASQHERLNVRFNSSHELTNWLTFEQRSSYGNTVGEGFPTWQWGEYYANPIMKALHMSPYLPAYDEDDEWSNCQWYSGENPYVSLDMVDRKVKNNNFSTNMSLTMNPLEGFSFTSRFAGNLGFADNWEFQDTYFYTPTIRRDRNELIQSLNRSFSWNVQNIANYTTQIGDNHNFDLMAGMEANKWWGFNIGGSRFDMPSSLPNMLYFNMSSNDTLAQQIIEGGGYEGRNLAFFGRLNYNYDGKYLLTLNFRRDGATNFGPDRRWGNFPSLSLGWKFSDEDFMESIDHIVSFGRIRYGYGETGANASSGFPYMSNIQYPATFRYSVDNNVVSQGAAPIQTPNPEIRWETVKMSNYGLDLAFFDNRITFTAEYYKKVNEDMLMIAEVPSIAGSWQFGGGDFEDGETAQPEINFGSVQNTGLEFTIGGRKMEGDLQGGFNVNMSFNDNKVLKLLTDSMVSGQAHSIRPITLTMEGSPISSFWGFETDGLFTLDDEHTVDERGRYTFTDQPYFVADDGRIVYAQRAQPGDIRYIDNSGDGRVRTEDDRVILGDPHPDMVFGFSFDLRYGNWDFSAFFNGTYGNDIFNGTKEYLYYTGGYNNRAAAFTDRYHDDIVVDDEVIIPANHDTDIPRHNSENYTYLREFYIEDGSYLRLRNATLGYTFPKELTSRFNIDNIRIFVSGTNLFTLTRYTGLNPEVSGQGILSMGIDYGVYPTTQMFSLGVNLSF